MINIIITSYNEPKATIRAVQTFLNQKTKKNFKIIVVDPFPVVGEHLKKNIKDKRVDFFLDPGEGKSYALNLLLDMLYSKNKDDLFIFTDGDVYVSDNALERISKHFEEEKVGCVTAKPVSVDSRKTKYGYWSHFLFEGINKVRKNLSNSKKFFECSGYLFAIRNGVIRRFPLEVSEDCIIPYLFWNKGYSIVYEDKVKVYVKNPSSWKDWLNQKIRNVKGHENVEKFTKNMPRTKSFFNEIKHGVFFILIFPKNLKEVLWTIELYFARLALYLISFRQIRSNKKYDDGWRETEINSTKPLD